VAPVTVNCSPASGSSFQVGSTTVRCTATAANQQTSACSFNVTVTPPAPRLSRTRFLAFGDSLTEGEVSVVVQSTGQADDRSPWFRLVIVPQAAYPTQLQQLLRARYTAQTAAIGVTNAGRSGEWATEGAKRFPDVMANQRPEAVVLLEGANDLAALGNAGISPAVLAIEAMAKEARFRNARVFVATLPPPRPGPRALPQSLVQNYNGRLQSVARGEGAVLVDMYAALVTDVNRYIGVDGVHPTEAGYRRMAEAVFDAIRQELEVR
jgi:lysophospholipase L1-like esterase